MFRRDLIAILRDQPTTLTELARQLDLRPRELEQDLEHLAKSLKHTELLLEVAPAQCRKCGFEFASHKMHKPSKCPECWSSWITEPRIEIKTRAERR